MTCPRSNTTLLLWPWKLLVRSILSCTYSQFPFWNGLASSFQTETFFLLLCKWAGDEESKPHPLPLMAGSLKCFWLPWNVPLSSFWIGQLSQRKVELAGPWLQVNILRTGQLEAGGRGEFTRALSPVRRVRKSSGLLSFLCICGPFPYLSAC